MGKLNGHVAPINSAASRRIQRLSFVKNQLITAQKTLSAAEPGSFKS